MNLEYKLTKLILDLIFPNYCLRCKKLDYLICSDCLKNEKLQKPNLCPHCLQKSEMGVSCRECREKNPKQLDGLFYLQFYREKSVLIKALFELKYEMRKDFAEVLGERMGSFWKIILKEWLAKKQIASVCLMPAHDKKLKKRGFNQVELIWKGVIKNFPELQSWEKKLLEKIKNTKTQMSLNGEDRKTNAENSLRVKGMVPQKVLIVDDIGTSLSTLNEASRVLKEAGCQEVYAWVLARQILD